MCLVYHWREKKKFGSNGIHVVWLESVKAFHEVYKETNIMQSIVGMMRIYRVEHFQMILTCARVFYHVHPKIDITLFNYSLECDWKIQQNSTLADWCLIFLFCRRKLL